MLVIITETDQASSYSIEILDNLTNIARLILVTVTRFDVYSSAINVYSWLPIAI
jgi:hypothetical protein